MSKTIEFLDFGDIFLGAEKISFCCFVWLYSCNTCLVTMLSLQLIRFVEHNVKLF